MVRASFWYVIAMLVILQVLCCNGFEVITLSPRYYSVSSRLFAKNLINSDKLAEFGLSLSDSPRLRRNKQRAELQSDINLIGDQATAGIRSDKRIIPQGQPRLQELINPNRLKILGGKARGRKIDSPNVYLRPMMSKVREAVFSSLTSLNIFAPERGTRVLDIFAGAGSVGLESLSRGAVHATFVDLAIECTDTVLQNAVKCGFLAKLSESRNRLNEATFSMQRGRINPQEVEGQVQVVTAKAEEVLARPNDFGLGEPYHFISLTPPYQEVSYPELISLLCTTSLLMPDSIVLLEYPLEMGTLPHILGEEQQLIGLRNRRYGRTVLALYVYRPSRHYDIRPEEFTNNSIRTRK
jgi:16S rRNA (guanine(966)-N(2))-methyltransferase RsmD